jgi:transcriptional regulator with PAS, ATPase and Fis domain
MINMHEGGILSPSLAPLKIRNAVAAAPAAPGRAVNGAIPGAQAESVGEASIAPVLSLAELEAEAIRRALARYGHSTKGKIQAAAALGIGVATLYRKIQAEKGG